MRLSFPMPRRPVLWLAFAFALLAACESTPGQNPDDAVATSRAAPDWTAPNFVVPARSATMPEFDEPNVVFNLPRSACSRASDAYGASDCATGASRTVISTGKVWDEGVEWKLDQRFLYSFEFWVDPDLTYPGYRNARSTETNGVSSRLSIARWEMADTPMGQLFDLKVDATRGVTFMGRVCVPPEDFGQWHRFNLRLRWADDDTGFIEVRCDKDLHTGVPLYARSGFPTNRAIQCLPENNCNPARQTGADRFNLQLGIIADAGGNAEIIPPDGLTIKMRRILVRRLYVVFGRVEDF